MEYMGLLLIALGMLVGMGVGYMLAISQFIGTVQKWADNTQELYREIERLQAQQGGEGE